MSGWTSGDLPHCTDRVFVVTGGNSGIGWEAARMLAEHRARVILACRNEGKARAAVEAIQRTAPDGHVEAMALDLASLASIERFAKELGDKIDRLDGLLNNAGLMALPFGKTEDGFEMQLGVNHLGHFALTGRLLPLLRRTEGARVVNVSSHMHRLGRIDLTNLMSERRYDRWRAYNQSKLANLLFTRELARRLREARAGLITTAAHPGYSATSLQGKGAAMEGGSKMDGLFMRFGNSLMAQTAASGALPTLRAALDPEAKNGDYFGPGGPFEIGGPAILVHPAKRAEDDAMARALWDRSVELTRVAYADL